MVWVVVSVYALTFVSLRLRHNAQVEATQHAIFYYSDIDSSGKKLASRLQNETRVETLCASEEGALQRLKSLGIEEPIPAPSIILPSRNGFSVASGEKTIEAVLTPVFGGQSQSLRGSITALAGIAIWLIFAVWGRSVQYLGVLWPAAGALALAWAAPSCPTCLGSRQDGWVVSLGLGSLCLAMLVLSTPAARQRWLIWAICFAAASGGIVQSIALYREPKLCSLCIIAAICVAGLFWVCRSLLVEPGARLVLGSRSLAVAVVGLSLIVGGRHLWSSPAVAKEGKSYHSVVGRSLADYAPSLTQANVPRIVLVSLPTCGACETARKDLAAAGVSFYEIPYRTIVSSPTVFNADFTRIAPLLLICDPTGKILRAEAGWPSSPEEKHQLIKGLRRSLGGDDERKD